MRYSVYKFLKGVSDSVVEAILHLKEHPESINMLSDCTEAILAIKTALEENKEICPDEIDNFFEKIDKIVECIENNKSYIERLDELYTIVVSINEFCKSQIKYKFRIVFFAELGSKWDSMDSVYWAYKNREDCDVAVVLAPIYRAVKYPNGEVKSDVIYRDYLTEMGIEHIPFKDYDIKKDMPDMVFTSQPYESVTPEQFWAENIAPYTRLVYLPYFTSGGIVEDEQKYVQCQMPIHKLAWKIACQSEEVKEVYSKYSHTNGNNLIACGLPKWDWVVNMDKRDIKLPKEWEKIKGKKVVLRNVHYLSSSRTEDNGECSIIKEIRLEMKKALEDNIAYIFRFHPMMETMFKLYHPNFLEEWNKLKKEINDSQNFIIDTNETYDCAFKFSDAFFSGPTSLIHQYLLTKKPVMTFLWGNFERTEKLEKKPENFLPHTKFYGVDTAKQADNIKEKILDGKDDEFENRMELIKKYFPNADGHIGERLSEILIKEILKEDEVV